MSKNIVSNFFKHIILISKHKWLVFKFSCKLGIPFRGFMHDWSKFSIDEFWEGVKYYDGTVSPITKCKQNEGYSKAWLHHKGRNKHHVQYWLDFGTKGVAPVIPYKYMAEMICDKMSASITYNGKNWTNSSQYEYWQKEKTRVIVNPKISFVRLYGLDKCGELVERYTQEAISALDAFEEKDYLVALAKSLTDRRA